MFVNQVSQNKNYCNNNNEGHLFPTFITDHIFCMHSCDRA